MKNLTLNNKKLAVALLVQVVLILVLWWPRGAATGGKKGFLEPLDLSKVTEIQLWEKPEANKIILKKTAGVWIVPERQDYPADAKKITELFDTLEKFNPGFPVVQTNASYERLEVSEQKFQRKVAFLMEGEKEAKEGFYLGTSPQFRKTHIRRLDQKEVYTTSAVTSGDLPIVSKEWLQRKVLDVDSENIASIEVKRGRESLVFVRKEVEVPSPEPKDKAQEPTHIPLKESQWFVSTGAGATEKRVDKSKFDASLRKLSALALSEVLGNAEKMEYGMMQPRAEIKITLKTPQANVNEQVLVVGGVKDSDYIVQLKGSPFFVTVLQYQLKELLEGKAADFLEKTS